MNEVKVCTICGKEKSVEEFYLKTKESSQRRAECRTCQIERISLYRKTNPEYRERLKNQNKEWLIKNKERAVANQKKQQLKNPMRTKAIRKVRAALESGKLEKDPCVVCGAIKVEGHHWDYHFPLSVVWLCREHHKNHHIILRKIKSLKITSPK